MSMAIGTPQYGGKKKLNFKLQDGENVYRILPPLGELAATGVWAVYQSQHWGYKGSKGMRPFCCIQKKDFKTKMIKVQCPECDKIAEKTALYTDKEKLLKSEGKTDEQVKEQLKPLGDWLFAHNLDKKWFVNAMTVDGKIGRLAIPHKMYTQLQEVIADLVSKKGVDPIGVDGGVWFTLIRTGKGLQTSHRVTVVEESVMVEVGGRKQPMTMIKPAPLTGEVIARLGNEAYDLQSSFRTLNYDEINRLVTSGGDPEIVDSVFATGDTDRAPIGTPPDADEPEPGAVASSMNAAAAAPLPPLTTAPATATVAAAPAADPTAQALAQSLASQRAQLEAQLAALQAQLAAQTAQVASAPIAVAAPVSSAAPAAPSAMNDDDFIKQFGFSK